MSRGTRRGDIRRTNGAWLVRTLPDGTVEREVLLTFDPFGLGRGRTHHQTLGYPRYAAWKRERIRFLRHRRAAAARRAAGDAAVPR